MSVVMMPARRAMTEAMGMQDVEQLAQRLVSSLMQPYVLTVQCPGGEPREDAEWGRSLVMALVRQAAEQKVALREISLPREVAVLLKPVRTHAAGGYFEGVQLTYDESLPLRFKITRVDPALPKREVQG